MQDDAGRSYIIYPDDDSDDPICSVMLIDAGAVVRTVHGGHIDDAIACGEQWIKSGAH